MPNRSGKANRDYMREWRRRRKALGLDTHQVGERSNAEYQRQRRAKARAQGKEERPRFLDAPDFVFWDGEGLTITPATGLPDRAEWEALVRGHAEETFAAALATEGPFWEALDQHGGRIIPERVRDRGRWRNAGEYVDIPRHLLSTTGRPNIDKIADVAGVTCDEAREFFARHPRRPKFADHLRAARIEFDELKPRAGKHVYTLFANSRGDYIENLEGLSTTELLEFFTLTAQKYPGARHVIFVGSYDTNMILRDLERDQMMQLYRGGLLPVTIEHDDRAWAISWRQRKSFAVAKLGRPRWKSHPTKGRVPNIERKAVLWDVWGFFQASFVGALRSWFTDAELRKLKINVAAIEAMKQQRSGFTKRDRARVRKYCFAECRAGELLVRRLADHLRAADLHPPRYDGSGAVAGALMRAQGVKNKIIEPPRHLARAIACAYAGGRIELCKLGHGGKTFGADIRSAYPAAAATLPNLHGDWRPTATLDGFSIARVTWDFDRGLPWYPLFYRRSGGSILFPAVGDGWLWAPEIFAAQAFAEKHGGAIQIHEAWKLEPIGPPPFEFVPKIFEQRRQWKREGRGAEKILKLALNSLYGKTAQQLGGGPDRLPPYFSLAWAGWITSATRARLVEAGTANPGAVVSFATDGIFTTADLGINDPAGGLGTWEDSGTATEFVGVQAGVYWAKCLPCKAHNEPVWHPKYRGFDKEGLETPAPILAAWEAGARALSVPVTRFVTIGSALAGEDLWPFWGTWRTTPRKLDLTGLSAKRLPVGNTRKCARGFVDLEPVWNLDYDVGGAGSAPYAIAWENWEDDGELIDGVPAHVFEDEADDTLQA